MAGEGGLWFPGRVRCAGKIDSRRTDAMCALPVSFAQTYHWQSYSNALRSSFDTLPGLTCAIAFLYFRETSPYRKMLHRFKYGACVT